MPFKHRIKPLREWSRAVFTLDARSLAVYRIGLGLMVLSDHIMRAFGMEWFYTNKGVYPTSAIWSWVKRFRKPCVHALSGGIELQIFLFVLAGLAAILLIVGWRSKLMSIICWFLTISIQHRFVQINSGADIFLSGMLFWSMFVPLGARFSLDARRRPDRSSQSNEVYSAATACMVLQIVLVYYFNVVNKYGASWYDGSAVLRALHIDQYATPLGAWVRDVIPWITYPMAYTTVGIETTAMLLFVPWFKGWIRMYLVAAFWVMHVGFNSFMYLALFSPISMMAWLCIIPARAWDIAPGFKQWNLKMRRGSGPRHRVPKLIGVALLATFFVLPAWANFAKTYKWTRPPQVTKAARFMRLNQIWKMFAPTPLRTDFWWVVEARTKDGKKLDLMRDGERLTWKKPRYSSQMYITGKHRRLWMSLKCDKKPLRCKRVLDRMCRDHNEALQDGDPNKVVRTILWKMKERTPKNLRKVKNLKVKKVRAFRRQCPGYRKAGKGKKKGKGKRKRKKKGKLKGKAKGDAKGGVAPTKLNKADILKRKGKTRIAPAKGQLAPAGGAALNVPALGPVLPRASPVVLPKAMSERLRLAPKRIQPIRRTVGAKPKDPPTL